jgi:D-lactate dehydrogenase
MARGNAARHLARLARLAGTQPQQEATRSISTLHTNLPVSADNTTVQDVIDPSNAAHFSQKRHKALAARVQVNTQTAVVPEITTDLYGAISAVSQQEVQEGAFKNVDGHRFEDGRYKAFSEEISAFIPEERQFTDPVRTFAYGTDASFYRLNPKLVVKVHSEAEIKKVLPIAKRLGVPVTFRAAGTSLSGQAITDSVLLKLSHTGRNFRNFTVHVSGQQLPSLGWTAWVTAG